RCKLRHRRPHRHSLAGHRRAARRRLRQRRDQEPRYGRTPYDTGCRRRQIPWRRAMNAAQSRLAGAGPVSGLERLIAWRYLRAKRKETVISVISAISFIGIMLGVATLIVVMAVMNGFRAELLTRILGINGHLVVQPVERPLEDYEAVAERIASVKGVKFVMPLVEGQVFATGRIGAGTGALVRGVRPEDIANLSIVSGNIRDGSMVGFASGEGVAIGTRMADNLGLSVGDVITLISPDGDVTPFGTTPRQKSYPIAAIF